MPAGDGLLVRIKPRGNCLAVRAARAIAAFARRYGNGALTLTARGNLQIRGVGEAALPALTEALDALGLLDDAAEGEAVRNVLSDPLAGADPEALCDIRPAVEALEHRLATDPALWRLPAKFAWSAEAGGRCGFADLRSDVRFTAVRRDGAVAMAVTLDGGARRAVCALDGLPETAARLAAAFLALCAERGLIPHRMRDLVAAVGAEAVLRRAGLSPTVDAAPKSAPPLPVGIARRGPWSFVVVAPALGFLDAATLDGVTVRAAAAGAADLRLTPWRSLVVAGLDEAAATALAADVATLGLILDPDDARLCVAACVGAPACHRATTPVPADAVRLASIMPHGLSLHVSGCAKGCAQAAPAPITLVGRDGRYDLVRDGRADDPPMARSLSVAGIRAEMAALAEAAS